MKIYHNPRCSKSRQTLNLIKENGVEPEIVLYLKTPPTKEELQILIKQLTIQPSQLLRKGEKIYKEQFKGKEMAEEDWIDIMIAHPKLIERPIVVKDGKAVLGRPPENVLDLM
ncbi:MAG: arsenate reductase (glutaredoxin) [Saprospiraceae bacterium]